jgi:hypothetical protein
MPDAFLPLNVTNKAMLTRAGAPLLALVDAEHLERLSQWNWISSGPAGLVYRFIYCREASARERRWVYVTKSLAEEASTLVQPYPRNGDRLDCRIANLTPLDYEGRPKVPPGSSFAQRPDYTLALVDRRRRAEELALRFIPGAKPRISKVQLKEFLEGLLVVPEFRGATLPKLRDLLFDATNVRMQLSQIRGMLSGRTHRLTGFEAQYQELASLYPSRKDKRTLLLQSLKTP